MLNRRLGQWTDIYRQTQLLYMMSLIVSRLSGLKLLLLEGVCVHGLSDVLKWPGGPLKTHTAISVPFPRKRFLIHHHSSDSERRQQNGVLLPRFSRSESFSDSEVQCWLLTGMLVKLAPPSQLVCTFSSCCQTRTFHYLPWTLFTCAGSICLSSISSRADSSCWISTRFLNLRQGKRQTERGWEIGHI